MKKNEEWKKYRYKIRLNIRGTPSYLSVGKPQLVGKPTVERTLSASERSDNWLLFISTLGDDSPENKNSEISN